MPEGKSLSCGMRCNQVLLSIFNGLFVLGGIILIIIGAYSLNLMLKANSPYGIAVFILVIGCIIFITSIVGCCGAINLSVRMLQVYGALMITILVLSIAALIAAFVLRKKTSDALETQLRGTIATYDTNPADETLWDLAQAGFDCCGVASYTDWKDNVNLTKTNSVPDSCCKNMTDQCGYGQRINPTNIYTQGCLDAITSISKFAYLILGCIAAAIAILMVIGIILAFCLAHAVGNTKEYQSM